MALLSATAGKYIGYRCVAVGKYIAVVDITTVLPNGKKSTQRVCEYGAIDLDKGTYKYDISPVQCPSSTKYTLKRTSSLGKAKDYTCK